MEVEQKMCRALSFMLIILALAPMGSAYPDTTSSSSVTLEDYDRICGNLGTSGSTTTAAAFSAASSKKTYCDAAQSSKLASETNSVLWKSWAGVATVCFGACAASFAGKGNIYICPVASTAGAILDAVKTQQFQTAMMTIVGVGINVMMNRNSKTAAPEEPAPASGATAGTTGGTTGAPAGAAGPASDPPKQVPKERDLGACVMALSSGMNAFTNHSSMKSNESTAVANLQSANDITNDSNSAASSATVNLTSAGSATTQVSSGTTAANTTSSSSTTQSSSASGCSGASSDSNITIQCAIAADPTLPQHVASPRFRDDFQKVSGIDFGQFAGSNTDSPQNTLASLMGGPSASPEDTAKLTAALKTASSLVVPQDSGSSYAAGGGRFNSGSSDDNSIGDMMNNLMGQLLPKKDGDAKQNNSATLITFDRLAPLASVQAERRDVSIFDRVKYRYYVFAKKMGGAPL